MHAGPNIFPHPLKPNVEASLNRAIAERDSAAQAERILPKPIPITQSSTGAPASASSAVVAEPATSLSPVRTPRIALKSSGRILLLSLADVIAFEAQGNYVLVQLESSSYRLRESISAMSDRFQNYGFVRIHRSVVINGSHVREIEPQATGDYVVRTHGGMREYLGTRTFRKNLASLADIWIGSACPDSRTDLTQES